MWVLSMSNWDVLICSMAFTSILLCLFVALMTDMKIDVCFLLTLIFLGVDIVASVGCLLLFIGVVKFEELSRLIVFKNQGGCWRLHHLKDYEKSSGLITFFRFVPWLMFGLNCQTSWLSSKTSSPSISYMKESINHVKKCSFDSSFYYT